MRVFKECFLGSDARLHHEVREHLKLVRLIKIIVINFPHILKCKQKLFENIKMFRKRFTGVFSKYPQYAF